jgi:hypothetical protein
VCAKSLGKAGEFGTLELIDRGRVGFSVVSKTSDFRLLCLEQSSLPGGKRLV